MIPNVLGLALIGGLLLPRRGIWVVIAATVLWIVQILIGGFIDSAAELAGSIAFGVGNAVVGFGLGSFVRGALGRATFLR